MKPGSFDGRRRSARTRWASLAAFLALGALWAAGCELGTGGAGGGGSGPEDAVGQAAAALEDGTQGDGAACALSISGQCAGFEYRSQCDPTGFECGADAIPSDSGCEGHFDECKPCPAGTHAVDADGDGCEEKCDCCPAIKCPSVDGLPPPEPIDGDGDGCADTCPEPGESCDEDEQEACEGCPDISCPSADPKHPLAAFDSDGDECADACPCSEAIGGQCAGFDYSGQCGLGALDCGSSGVRVDKDCDGHYDGCAACPAGTEPVDRDGDGCAEVCDCSQEVVPPADGFEIVDVDEDGVPTWVNGAIGMIGPVNDPSPAGWTQPVRDALTGVAGLLHIEPASLTVDSVFTDSIGDTHVRLVRSIGNLAVLDDELIVHVRGKSVYSVNGEVRADLPIASTQSVGGKQAAQAALTSLSGQGTVQQEGTSTLAYYRTETNVLQLVWVVQVVGMQPDQLPIDEEIIVSAADGTILDSDSNIQTARNRQISSAGNSTTLPGTLQRSEGGVPVADAIVNTNYDRVGTTYDCYMALFGRDSYDDDGADLRSTVHYGTQYNNAFWNKRKKRMVYGDGDVTNFGNFATSLDVTVHELTHAVTGKTSKLRYKKESGGLNEAMSDIFAATCQWWANGQVVTAATWLLSEDVFTPSTAGDASRYMNDPADDGVSLDFYPDYSNGTDVHYSSGIANLAFFLLSQGGTHPQGKTSIVVPGIGIQQASQIFYRANTSLLGRRSKFRHAALATVQAAHQLGYGSAVAQAVRSAWEAVGVTFKAECESCFLSSQCAPGALCKWGKCATGGSVGMGGSCCRDHQCTTGSCNSANVCQCTSNSHCPSGQYCAEGFLGIGKNKCVPFKAECDSCVLDHQCAPAADCKWGKCSTGNSVGMGGSCCRDHQCTTGSCNSANVCQCTSDSHCPSGQRCAVGFLGIGKNKCVSYKAECEGCILDSQCAPSAQCKWGKCATHNSLTTGQSCCRDYQCTNGNCKSNNKCN